MSNVNACELPADALLRRYADGQAYTDCYVTDIPTNVSFASFVSAFYTTRLFKLERWLLGVLAKRPSSDAEAEALANADGEHFAAWHVEARAASQLLLSDFSGRTRSWLAIDPTHAGTRLFFGSAVVPAGHDTDGRARMGFVFRALLGFHRLYSVALLKAARRRVIATTIKDSSTTD
ncbi:MAG: hypothetical protein AAGJ86_12510 [Pseudomonadota bacterium]